MMAPTALQATQAFAWAVLASCPSFRPLNHQGKPERRCQTKTWKGSRSKDRDMKDKHPGQRAQQVQRPRGRTGSGVLEEQGGGLGVCYRVREGERAKRGGQDMHGLGEDLGFYPREVGPWRAVAEEGQSLLELSGREHRKRQEIRPAIRTGLNQVEAEGWGEVGGFSVHLEAKPTKSATKLNVGRGWGSVGRS